LTLLLLLSFGGQKKSENPSNHEETSLDAVVLMSLRYCRKCFGATTMDLSSLHPLDRQFFRHVPLEPTWINIGLYMGKQEAQRVFPDIPELAGIEDLVGAIEDDSEFRETMASSGFHQYDALLESNQLVLDAKGGLRGTPEMKQALLDGGYKLQPAFVYGKGVFGRQNGLVFFFREEGVLIATRTELMRLYQTLLPCKNCVDQAKYV